MWYYEDVRLGRGLPFHWFTHHVPLGPLHWHKELELLYISAGPVKLTCGDEEYILGTGDVMAVNCNVIHEVAAVHPEAGEVTINGIQIDPAFCRDFYPELERMVFDPAQFLDVRQAEPRARLAECMGRMMTDMAGAGGERLFLFSSQAYRLLYLLVTGFAFTLEDQSQRLPQKDRDRLQRIIAYVEEHYARRISLREVAEREHMNLYYLSHFFREKTGVTFRDFLTSVRLEKAARKLTGSDARVMDILLSCGFSDAKNFYRQFREKYGLTPSDYRRQYGAPSCDRVDAVNCRIAAGE